jgi:hypothetical protein
VQGQAVQFAILTYLENVRLEKMASPHKRLFKVRNDATGTFEVLKGAFREQQKHKLLRGFRNSEAA